MQKERDAEKEAADAEDALQQLEDEVRKASSKKTERTNRTQASNPQQDNLLAELVSGVKTFLATVTAGDSFGYEELSNAAHDLHVVLQRVQPEPEEVHASESDADDEQEDVDDEGFVTDDRATFPTRRKERDPPRRAGSEPPTSRARHRSATPPHRPHTVDDDPDLPDFR